MKNNSKAGFWALTSINAFSPQSRKMKKNHSCFSDVKTKTIYASYIGEIVHAYVKSALIAFPRSIICMEFASELNSAWGKKMLFFPVFYDEVPIFKILFPSWAKETLHHPVADKASVDFIGNCLCTMQQATVSKTLTNPKVSHQHLIRSQAAESHSIYSYPFQEPDFLSFTQPEISRQGQRPSIKKPL